MSFDKKVHVISALSVAFKNSLALMTWSHAKARRLPATPLALFCAAAGKGVKELLQKKSRCRFFWRHLSKILWCFWCIQKYVSMTGICERHMSLVDACHIMGMVHLYKYWTLVFFTLTVKGSTIVCLLVMSDFLSFSHGLFILDKQRNDLCVDRQYHLVCHVAKCVSHGNVITMTRQTFGKFTPCMNVCQINLLWKQYDTFSLGSVHKPLLLVHLPNTPVMG